MKRVLYIALALVLVMGLAPGAATPSLAAAGTPDTSWYDASKTAFDIANADQLAGLAQLVNGGTTFAGKTVRLTASIDLSAYGKDYNGGKGWTPIGALTPIDRPFQGVFDGGDKAVVGLYINDTARPRAGLFGRVSGGTVKNLGLPDMDIVCLYDSGGVAGYITNNASVVNCWSTGKISVSVGWGAGGIVGYADNSSVKDSRSWASVSGGGGVGGVIGLIYNNSSVSNCFAIGRISGIGGNVGGVVGQISDGEVTNCYAAGDVSGTNSVGGVVGDISHDVNGISNNKLTNCYATGNVQGSDVHIGGVVGSFHEGEMKNCYSTGDVSGVHMVGGVAGIIGGNSSSPVVYRTARVINCYATGAVSGMGATGSFNFNYEGGLIGYTNNSTCQVINSAALNPSVTGPTSRVRRVAADTSPHAPQLSGNIAWNGMSVIRAGVSQPAANLQKGPDQLDGADVTKEAVHANTGFPTGMTTGEWTYQPNRLPGLFGKTVVMPVHLRLSGDPLDEDPPEEPPFYEEPPEEPPIPEDDLHGIDYQGVEDMIVPGTGVGGFSINLTRETITIPETYTVKYYSVNGGTKWTAVKAGMFSDANFPKLLNKDMALKLTDQTLDKNSKQPVDISTVVEFPKILKRLKAPAVAVNYLIGGAWAPRGDWLLTAKGKDADTTVALKHGLLIGEGDAAKKIILDGDTSRYYGQFYPGETIGISVKALPDTNKPVKTVYFVKTAPLDNGDGTYRAASKTAKVSASSELKPTAYKLDYKKEIVKLKKGDAYSLDGGISFTEVTEAKGIALDVSACITSGTAVIVKKAAIAKKPVSAAQTITPVSRAALTTDGVMVANGKLTLDKKYEVYNATANKWGGAPKVTASGEFDIRLKPTAKVTATGTTGNAASAPGKLKITYGEYAPGKNGVTAAEIVP